MNDVLSREELLRHYIRGLGVRTVLATIVAAFSFWSLRAGLAGIAFTPIIVLCAYEVAANIPYYFLGKRAKNEASLTWYSLGELVLDVLIITVALHFLGGINATFFAFFYALVIVYAGVVHSLRDCFLIATLSTLCYGSLLVLEYTGILAPFRGMGQVYTAPQQTFIFSGHTVLFFAIAHLTCYHAGIVKKSLKRLGMEKHQTDMICHTLVDGVLVMDPSDKVMIINSSARKLFFSGDTHDPTGQPIMFFPQLKSVVGLLRDASQGKGNMHSQEIIVTEQEMGNERIVQTSISQVKDPSGEVIGRVITFHDITSLKDVDRLKSEFVANVSHELRTPLASIKGYVENILDGIAGEITEQQRAYLLRVRWNSDRLALLISDLLDLSRIEAGKVELHPVFLSVADVAREVAEHLGPMAMEKGTAITVVESETGLRIHADKDKVSQILTNLIHNALKFTSVHGSILVRIARSTDNSIDTSVTDTGAGIPPEEVERIFEKFYQAGQPSAGTTEGTGLGLSIAKSLAELHGGRIRVESTVGQGSTFIVTLPIAGDAAL